MGTGVWSFTGVRVDVILEGDPLSKCCIAQVTGIWPLTSVRENVALEMGHSSRRVRTIWTGAKDHETGFTD